MTAALLLALGLAQGPTEVPFRLGENAIIADAEINGKKLSFMFDTGFSGAFVVDHNISIGKPTGTINLRDFVGTFQASTVKLNSVKLGSKVIDSTHMEAVMQPADYSFSYQTHCDGIMGFQVLQHEIFEINFEKKKFIFHPKTVDISTWKPDNKKTFLLKLLPIGANSMEMAVEAENGQKLYLALDTGNSFYATTHRDSLERIGLWPKGKKPLYMKQSMVASGAVDSWNKKMTNMKIFGVPVKTSYWDIIDLPSSSAESDGTVGFGFLKNFNIIIDYDRRRVWLDNFTGQVENEPEGTPGITALYVPQRKQVAVVRVSPESPAEKAGIKVGDNIIMIDGHEIAGAIGFNELNNMLNGKPNTTVKITASRGGDVKRYEIERKVLINE